MIQRFFRPTHCFAPLSDTVSSWASSRDPGTAQRAKTILERMQELYEAGSADVKPDNAVSFNTVMSVFAAVGNLGAMKRAESILHHMHELRQSGNLNVKPNTIMYSTVISGRARSRRQKPQDMLEYMKKAAIAGHQDCRPNQRTYAAVIKAYANSKHPEAASRIKALCAETKTIPVS